MTRIENYDRFPVAMPWEKEDAYDCYAAEPELEAMIETRCIGAELIAKRMWMSDDDFDRYADYLDWVWDRLDGLGHSEVIEFSMKHNEAFLRENFNAWWRDRHYR